MNKPLILIAGLVLGYSAQHQAANWRDRQAHHPGA